MTSDGSMTSSMPPEGGHGEHRHGSLWVALPRSLRATSSLERYLNACISLYDCLDVRGKANIVADL